jgi:hypothetical protein
MKRDAHDESRPAGSPSLKSIAMIDAHHHIRRPIDLTWLSGPQVPRIFGRYSAIRRDYTI